jgi:hypothetical protein
VLVFDPSKALCDRAFTLRCTMPLNFFARLDEIFSQAQQLQSYDKTDQV